VQAFGGSFVLSLSLSEGVVGRAHVVLEVCVGLRGEEEFHDFGVTEERGKGERRQPILKERTEREGGGTKGGGGGGGRQQEQTRRW
jgi:hypothetical protein